MDKTKKNIIKVMLARSKNTNQANNNTELLSTANKIAEYLTTTIFDHKEGRLDFALGLLQEQQVKKLKNILGQRLPDQRRISSTIARDILGKTSKAFRNNFRKETWAYRCAQTVESDKILGLDTGCKSKEKGGKKRRRTNRATKSENEVITSNMKTTRHKTLVTKVSDVFSEMGSIKTDGKKTSQSIGGKFLDNIKEIEKELQMYIEKGVRWLGLH